MNKFKICLLFFLSISLTVMTTTARNLEFHKPIPCFGCHGETMKIDYGTDDSSCGFCHNYRKNGIDVPKLESEHNPKICTACHMGNTIVGGSQKEIFHNGHIAVECTTCHTENNFTVIKIKHNGFSCVSCHGNQIHPIHIKNLDKICPICHGTWAKDKIYIKNGASVSSNESKQNSNLEKITIFSLIKNLFNSITGGT